VKAPGQRCSIVLKARDFVQHREAGRSDFRRSPGNGFGSLRACAPSVSRMWWKS